MSTHAPVLVGVSGPAQTQHAVDWALSYAASVNTNVELVHVVDMSWRSTPSSFAEAALLDAEQELRNLASQCTAQSGVPVHATVMIGHPTRLLIEHSAGKGMLVLGTRSSLELARQIFNTRTLRVTSRVDISTVVIPDSGVEGTGIVVGVDDSEFSVAPLAFAAREADRLGEPLTVVHSWHAPRPWSDRELAAWPTAPEDEERRVLAEAVAGLAQTYPDLVVRSEVVFGRAANALYAAAEGARMLVVGSHGRQGLEKAWLGSTSEELVLAMPTAVAVIRS